MPESKVGLFRNRKSKSPHYVLFYAHTVCVHCCTCPWTAEKITSRRSLALPCTFCIFCKFCICIFCILSQLGLRCRLGWSPGPQIRLDRTRLQLLVVAKNSVLRLPGERNVQHCVLQNLYAISQGRPSGGKRSQGRYWRWVALVFFLKIRHKAWSGSQKRHEVEDKNKIYFCWANFCPDCWFVSVLIRPLVV